MYTYIYAYIQTWFDNPWVFSNFAGHNLSLSPPVRRPDVLPPPQVPAIAPRNEVFGEPRLKVWVVWDFMFDADHNILQVMSYEL